MLNFILIAVVTAYSGDCRGCNGVTASGVPVEEIGGWGLAADLRYWRIGDCVELFVDGQWLRYWVMDTGGGVKGRGRFDILVATEVGASRFGVQRLPYRECVGEHP